MNTSPSFVPLTNENLPMITERLTSEGGFFLTVWRAGGWYFTVHLYDRPSISLLPERNPWVHSHHRDGNATNPLNDRQYRLGRWRTRKGVDDFFPSLAVGAHRLTIGPQWGGGSEISVTHGQYFYVPLREYLPDALTHIFNHPIVPLDPPLTKEEVKSMIAYILEDLETKDVVRQIIAAGTAADLVLGMG